MNLNMRLYMWMIIKRTVRGKKLENFANLMYMLRRFLMLRISGFTEMYLNLLSMQQVIVHF